MFRVSTVVDASTESEFSNVVWIGLAAVGSSDARFAVVQLASPPVVVNDAPVPTQAVVVFVRDR